MGSTMIKRNQLLVIGLIALALLTAYFGWPGRHATKPAQIKPRESDTGQDESLLLSKPEPIVPSGVPPAETNIGQPPSLPNRTELPDRMDRELEAMAAEIYRQAPEALDQALFDKKYGDPREFVKLRWYNGMNYKQARRLIKKDQLPLLHQMLQDPNYAPYWHAVARLIGFVSDDPNSIPVLLDYFQRDDSWNWEKRGTLAHRRLGGKIDALKWIGKIGRHQVNALLRAAVTEDGAAELAKAWLGHGLVPKSSTFNTIANTIVRIRGRAAEGLVLTEDKENIDVVKRLFAKEIDYCRANKKISRLYNPLRSAIAYHDFIADNDREALFSLFGSQELRRQLRPYIKKYSWQQYVQQASETGGAEQP